MQKILFISEFIKGTTILKGTQILLDKARHPHIIIFHFQYTKLFLVKLRIRTLYLMQRKRVNKFPHNTELVTSYRTTEPFLSWKVPMNGFFFITSVLQSFSCSSRSWDSSWRARRMEGHVNNSCRLSVPYINTVKYERWMLGQHNYRILICQ